MNLKMYTVSNCKLALLKGLSIVILSFFSTTLTKAQSTETFASGSYIINMGSHSNVLATNISHELKPFGMIYDLLKNYNVPIFVVINPTKSKDGVDFTYNGVSYKGGAFVIDKKYISSTVASRIIYWNSQGVLGNYTNSSLTLNTTLKYTSVPTWTLDAQNGSIAIGFFTNAGIPCSAYNYLAPAQLGACSDIFVMPHADPNWATHGNLLNWNLQYKGAIWLGCHAGSALENMYNPANTSQQTNFLTTKATTTGSGIILPTTGSRSYAQNSLILWGNHSNATIPYNTLTGTVASGTLANAADPVAQFIGVTDAAHLNGSEQVYLPVLGQGWRSSTKIITYDPSQANVPSNSAGPAVIIAYGKGFGDDNRGYVMMESGHSINKGSAGDVAAQRAFFNWSFLSTGDKASIKIDSISGIPVDRTISSTQNYNIKANYVLQSGVSNITFTWSCIRTDNGANFGSFVPNSTTASFATTFIPQSVINPVNVVITLKMTDACGRQTFESIPVTVRPGNRAPIANPDNENIPTSCYTDGISQTINVLSNDSDLDNDPLTVTNVSGDNGTWTTNGTTVTFTPNPNFFGTASATYTVCDDHASCSTSTITVGVGSANTQGCFPGSVFDAANSLYPSSQTNTSVSTGNNALAESDYDQTDNTSYAILDNNSDVLTLNFGSLQSSSNFDSVVVYLASQNEGSSVTASFSYSTNGSSYTTLGSFTTSSNDLIDDAHFKMPSSGLQYLKIQRTSGSSQLWIDAARVEHWGCVAAVVNANDDEVTVSEDITTEIDAIANDDNPGNLPLKLKIIASPKHGLVSINTDNTISYVSTDNYPSTSNGIDSITYQICNNLGYCSTGKVYITITDDGCGNGQYKSLNAVSNTTLTIQGSTSNMIDSYIKKDRPTENKGNEAKLELGKKSSSERRDLFQFNTLNTIPSNAVIQSAVFSIYKEGGDNYNLNLAVYKLTQSWTESGVTWDKRDGTNSWTTAGGTYTSTPIATLAATYANGYKDFTVTSLVQNWVNGNYSNYGLLVKQPNPSHETDKKYYITSSEGVSNHTPKLVITYSVVGTCSNIPNRAPFANPDDTSAFIQQSIDINSLLNDADPDGNGLSINAASCNSSSTGTVSIINNIIRYTPNANRALPRTDTLIYTISDGTLTDQALVFIRIEASKPDIVTDYSNGQSGVQQTIQVCDNDSDPQGLTLTAPSITSEPKHGSYNISGNNLIYTPSVGFYGKDTMIYERCQTLASGCNAIGLCDTAFIIITVNNQAPEANDKTLSTYACEEKSFSLADDISDPENETLTVNFISGPSHGSINQNSDGTYTYSPTPGFPGIPGIAYDTIVYNVTDPGSLISSNGQIIIGVNGTPANAAPIAVDDLYDTATITNVGPINQDLYVDVLSNDTDADGNSLSIQLTAYPSGNDLLQPKYGTISIFNGEVLYTPDFNFIGVDSFEYVLYDSMPAPTDTSCPTHHRKYDVGLATVIIQPSPIIKITGTIWNDVNGSAENTFNNIYSATENGTSIQNSLYVYCVDSTGTVIDYSTVNPDGTYTLAGIPTNRSDLKLILTSIVTTVGSNEPSAEISDTHWKNTSPIVRLNFSTGNLFINEIDWGVEELPTAIAADTVRNMKNQSGFTNIIVPPTAFIGTDPSNGIIDSIVITDFPSNVNSITIDGTTYINGGTCPPATICSNWPGSITIPTNTSGNPTQPILVDPVNGGNLRIKIPFKNIDNAGKESFNSDTLIIELQNNVPIATDDTAAVDEDGILNGKVCDNDTESNDGGNNWNLVSTSSHGSLIFNGCDYTYTPDSNYNGQDTFYYSLCDIDGDCDTAMVVITINPVDDFPIAVDDTASVDENSILNGKVCENDTESGDGGNDWNLVSTTSHGSLVFNGCDYTYTPDSNYNGQDTFYYSLCDIDGDCDTAVVVITVNCIKTAAPDIHAIQPTCALATGSIAITAPISNGLLYSINDSTYQADTLFSNLASGTYYVTIKNGSCISDATTAVIGITPVKPNAPSISIIQPTCSIPSGSIKIISPIAAGYTYSINGSSYQTDTIFSGLSTGTYNVTVKNTDGCISTATVAKINTTPNKPNAPTINITHPTCSVTTGTITITAPTGSGYSYSINGSTYQSSTIFTGVATGTYNVTVRTGSGCNVCSSNATSVVINAAQAKPDAPSVNLTQPTCSNAKGTITITAPTGSGYTYSINGSTYQSGTTFNNVASGTYNVTVRTGTGCNVCTSNATSAVINAAPAKPTKPTVSITQPTCSTTTGTITITAPIGSGYTYSINGSTYQSGTTFNTLTAGSYSVTVKNTAGCISTPTTASISAAPVTPVAPSINVTQPSCAVATGTITISTPTGTGLTYSVNGSTYQSNTTFVGLIAGSYNVTVKNSSGCAACTSTATVVTINTAPAKPTKPTVSITQPTCSITTGTISITAPTDSGYTYSINGTTYQSGTTFNTLNAGSYNVTVKNTAGCISTATTASISAAPTTPTAPTVNVTQPSCAVETGTITISAPTGSGYTYSFNGSTYQTSTTFDGLNAGTYNVTVRTGTGCNVCTSNATSAVINTAPAKPTKPTVSIAQPTCSITTGTITITAPTGSSYTYSINGSTYQSSTTFSGVASGTYNVTVKNTAGCISTTNVSISAAPITPAAPTVNVTQPSCAVSTGTITISAPTGTGLTYSINGNTYQSSTTFGGLNTGTYNVTVKNSSGCANCTSTSTVATINAAPSKPTKPTASIIQPTCAIVTGTITITAPTGPGYTYSINGSTYQSGTTFNNVTLGSYSITAKNTAGCISSTTTAVINSASCPNTGIYQTSTTCNDFNAGFGQKVTSLCYSASCGRISNVTPGYFFYYTTIIAPSTSFSVDIVQSRSNASFGLFSIKETDQPTLWNGSCSKVATGITVSTGLGRVTITNATIGVQYVLSVKYDSKTVIGSSYNGYAEPNCLYSFESRINNVLVANSQTNINMTASCSSSSYSRSAPTNSQNSNSTGTSKKPWDVMISPNPTTTSFNVNVVSDIQSPITIRIVDILGNTLEKTTSNNSLHQFIGKKLDKGIYFMEVIQGENRKTVKVEKL